MFGPLLIAEVGGGAGLGLAGDIEGGGAVEAPLGQGDVQDQFLLGFADGLEALEVVLEEGEEFAGVFGFEEVLVGFGGAGDGVAAGGGLASKERAQNGATRAASILGIACSLAARENRAPLRFWSTGAGGLFRVGAVGADLLVGGGVLVWIVHRIGSDLRLGGVSGGGFWEGLIMGEMLLWEVIGRRAVRGFCAVVFS